MQNASFCIFNTKRPWLLGKHPRNTAARYGGKLVSRWRNFTKLQLPIGRMKKHGEFVRTSLKY